MSTLIIDDQVIEMPFNNVTKLHIRRRRPSQEYIESHVALESVLEDSSSKSPINSQRTPASLGSTKSLRLHLDDVSFADPNFTRLGSLELTQSPSPAQHNQDEPSSQQRLRQKLCSFIQAAHAAGQPCAAPWIDLDHRQLPPPQQQQQKPSTRSRTEPASPRGPCAPAAPPDLSAAAASASFRPRCSEGKGPAKRSMSEGNVMQDIAWQRLISVGCSDAPEPAAFGSFLARRNTPRTSTASSTAAAAAAATAIAPPPTMTAAAAAAAAAAPPPPGPPPACCSAADTRAAAGSTDGRGSGVFDDRAAAARMRGTDRAVFRAQVAAALGKGRAVWL